jgi:hypothetical protein
MRAAGVAATSDWVVLSVGLAAGFYFWGGRIVAKREAWVELMRQDKLAPFHLQPGPDGEFLGRLAVSWEAVSLS